jgi:uncharacterized membrane protein (UPF0127 family)
MRSRPLFWTAFLIAVLVIFLVVFDAVFHNNPSKMDVVLGGKTFVMDIADTPAEQEQGLSGRLSLAPDTGMIFIFDTPDNYGFWMQKMNFPLDIIWISSDYRIVHIEKNLSPETYPTVYYPNAPSKYVLEISGGLADENDIKIGDLIKISAN